MLFMDFDGSVYESRFIKSSDLQLLEAILLCIFGSEKFIDFRFQFTSEEFFL